jgi:hypothetical protein
MSDFGLEEMDTDGDGVADYAAGDTDGDGVTDTYALDEDQNGVWEAVAVDAGAGSDEAPEIVMLDTDQDGITDETAYDEDYDGDIDRTEYTDADGNLTGSSADTDGDGIDDQVVEDTDGDGIMDTFSYDTDGDGVLDTTDVASDPNVGDGGVHGGNEDEYYQAQAVSGQCGPTSAAMILSEHLGETVPYEDVVATAEEMGLMVENADGTYSGTWAQGMEQLMESYGVDVSIEYGDMEALEGYLDEGRDIIVAVDAYEIWGEGDAPIANHYLVVTEIDEESGIVTLNDPGQPDGASFEVPLEDFNDAWADGGNEMIVTDEAGPDGVEGEELFTETSASEDDELGAGVGAEAGAAAGGEDSDSDDSTGFAILKMLLRI